MGDIAAFLRKKGYEISPHTSNQEVQCISGVVIDATGWPTYLITKPNSCPVKAPVDAAATVNLLLMKLNFSIVVGCFEIDFRDGEIQLRSSFPTRTAAGAAISNPAKLLEPMFGRHITVLAKYSASIVRAAVSQPLEAAPPSNPAPILGKEADKLKNSGGDTMADFFKLFNEFILKRSQEQANDQLSPPQPPQAPQPPQPQAPQSPQPQAPQPPPVEKSHPQSPPQSEPKEKEQPQKLEKKNVRIFQKDQIQFMKDANGRKIKLGSGTFANVRKAKLHGSMVAVKVIKEELPMDLMEALENEVSVMSSLQHPNIVLLLGMCKEPAAIVMPFMAKGSLQNFINKNINLTFAVKLKLLADSARGMAYVHANKILHGDLKPLNILVDENNVAYVADFGLSKIKASSSSFRAGAGYSGFTLSFAAPELIKDGNMTMATDVYAFAVTMWVLATYKTPFSNQFGNERELLHQIENGLRPNEEFYRDDVPQHFKELVQMCWHLVPSKRPSFIVILDILEKMMSLPDQSQ